MMRCIDESNENDLISLAYHLDASSNIVVLTGAGISTSCGIPDFRSQDGLNSKTVRQACHELDLKLHDRYHPSGEVILRIQEQSISDSILDADLDGPCTRILDKTALWSKSTSVALHRWCVLLKEYIRQQVDNPSETHKFLGEIRRAGKLLHWYTQNIDGLESDVGCRLYTDVSRQSSATGPTDEPESFDVIQLHGNLSTAWCTKCYAAQDWDARVSQAFLSGFTLDCAKCQERAATRERNGRRPVEIGSLRTGVLLYGEDNRRAEVVQTTVQWDLLRNPSVFLILGTSLKVDGAAQLVRDIARAMHANGTGLVVMVDVNEPSGVWAGVVDLFVKMNVDVWALKMRENMIDLLFSNHNNVLIASEYQGVRLADGDETANWDFV